MACLTEQKEKRYSMTNANRIMAMGILLVTSMSAARAAEETLAVSWKMAARAAYSTMTITNVETAVLDPENWDKSYPGERYFDAIRPMLVRFPGAAEAISATLREGYAVEKAELVLDWEKQEGAGPERGRHGWGAEEEYAKRPGEWSALARGVLRPWSAANRNNAPTAIAFIKDAGFWDKICGWSDGKDRLTTVCGPLPLHAKSPLAAIDVTTVLSDPRYGRDLGARLRALEQQGFAVQKLELVDVKYNGQEGGWFDVYSWRVGTGYMKIWVRPPALRLVFRKATKADTVKLPPPLEFDALVAKLKAKPEGRPAMRLPDDWAAKIQRFNTKPIDMPDWMWARRNELVGIWGWNLGRFNADGLVNSDTNKFFREMTSYLHLAPHQWEGHLTSDFILAPRALSDFFPPAALDYAKVYWAGWTHPDVEDVENPRMRSYFRSYPRSVGTQNFSINSIAGCTLAGDLLQAPWVQADARYGIENLVLRNWGFYGGANQEVGDTYYQALSVAGLGIIAKYAEDPFDRLMGEIARDRQVEQLISVFHPGLRRLTYPNGRGELKYQMLYQDGPYHAIHSLSRKGALVHLDMNKPGADMHHIQVFGGEGPPARYALLMPWGPEEWANIVDDKPLPWTTYARWWHFAPDNAPGGWHVQSLGHHYALGSRTEQHGHNVVTPVTAQWRREAGTVTNMEQLSTLQMNYTVNGVFAQAMIQVAAVQQGGKILAMASQPPRNNMMALPNPDYAGGWRAKDPNYNPKAVSAAGAAITITSFGDVSKREVWIGDRKVDALSGNASPANPDPKFSWDRYLVSGSNSVFAKDGETICVKDGVSYAAIRPVALDPLERDQQVEVAYEWPVIYVYAFVYRSSKGLNLDDLYTDKDRRATAGFVIEVGDETEYGSFDSFRKHVAGTKLDSAWNAGKRCYDMAYRSGTNTLEMGYRVWDQGTTFYGGDAGPKYVRVNGNEDYGYPLSIQRDSPWSVQGMGGRIEKAGAAVESEKNHRTYLLSETKSGTYTGYNPLPDPIFWRFLLPGGAKVRADGRVGLLRVRARPQENTLWIDYRLKPGQDQRPDLAQALVLEGFHDAPTVILNDQPIRKLGQLDLNDHKGWFVPLREGIRARDVPGRLVAADALWTKTDAEPAAFFQDWYAVGPFDNSDFAGSNFQLKDFGPEKGLNLGASYQGVAQGTNGFVPATVKWAPLLATNEPAMSDQALSLNGRFEPTRGVLAYLAASIVSETDQTVYLLAGSDERLGVWINGERLIFDRGWRLAYRDQDWTPVKLKKGENSVLVKMSHGHESWRLYFRLADANGLPAQGIRYKGAH